MRVLLLALIYLLGEAYSLSVEEHIVNQQWENFKIEHKKAYQSLEEADYRKSVFRENLLTISEHNKLYHMGLSTYTMGMNVFGDLTDDEYQRYYQMPYYHPEVKDNEIEDLSSSYHATISDEPLPIDVDWRLLGAVTEVKMQGECGSCYAFTAMAALESQLYLSTKNLTSLSEQEIVDCTFRRKAYYNKGCLGGRIDNTFKYIIANKGVDTNSSYPYIAKQNPTCLANKTEKLAQMKKYVKTQPGNETDLQVAVARVGPVSVMVDGSGFKLYSAGLYDNHNCSSTKVNHGLVVVGYGVYNNKDFWLAKNSHGVTWGEEGYILMRRNNKNQCGIAIEPIYPLLEIENNDF